VGGSDVGENEMGVEFCRWDVSMPFPDRRCRYDRGAGAIQCRMRIDLPDGGGHDGGYAWADESGWRAAGNVG
jgi:hypothetical protein